MRRDTEDILAGEDGICAFCGVVYHDQQTALVGACEVPWCRGSNVFLAMLKLIRIPGASIQSSDKLSQHDFRPRSRLLAVKLARKIRSLLTRSSKSRYCAPLG